MKKEYINPEIEITEVEIFQELLAGSDPNVTVSNDDDLINPATGVEAPDLIDFGDDDVDW